MWHLSCGVSFLDHLGFNWYYQARLLSYYVSGGFGEGKKSRILFLYVCCGLYGGKEIDELLKMWKPRGVYALGSTDSKFHRVIHLVITFVDNIFRCISLCFFMSIFT